MADSIRDRLITGAYVAGSPEADGLDVDEVADALISARDSKKEKIKRRSQNFSAQRAKREGNRSQAEAFLSNDSKSFQSTGNFEEQERYPDPFGIPRSAVDVEGPNYDNSQEGYDRQRGAYVIVDRGKGKERLWRERGQFSSEPKYAKNKAPDMADPFTKPSVAPAGVGMGGPNGLATVLADKVIRGEINETDLVPGSESKTIRTLIQELAMEADPSLKRDADRAIGMQTAARDAKRFSPAQRAISDAAAEREAITYIANADNGISDINRIDTLGLASKKFNKGVDMSQFNVVQAVDPNTFGDVYAVESWPEGTPLGYRDANTDRWVADVNFSTSSPGNQPVSPTATWISGNLPDFGQAGGTSFGARQVNPGDELALLNSRLGQFGLPTGIRGIDDLEQVVRNVVVDAAFKGNTMYNFDPAAGKAVGVTNPGLEEVLYGMDYTKDEKTRLAQALQTVAAAQLSPVNSVAKEMYARGLAPDRDPVVRGFENDVQLSRITDERVGRGKSRKSVRKLLSQLDGSSEVFADRDASDLYGYTPTGERVLLPEAQQDLIDARIALGDAQRPFQGSPQGELPERARFLSARAAKMSPEERVKAYGPAGNIGTEVEKRKQAADQQMATRATAVDPVAEAFRKRDAQFEAEGQARLDQDSFNAKLQLRGDNPLQPITSRINSQQATSAVNNAPPDPIPLAIRGEWMGGPGQGNVASTFDTQTLMASAAQKAAPMQEPLAGITYNETNPDPWQETPGTASGIDREVIRRKASGPTPTQGPRLPGIRQKLMNSIKRAPSNFRSAPRNQRYGAVAGGVALGAAGLSGLFGDNEEEQYR